MRSCLAARHHFSPNLTWANTIYIVLAGTEAHVARLGPPRTSRAHPTDGDARACCLASADESESSTEVAQVRCPGLLTRAKAAPKSARTPRNAAQDHLRVRERPVRDECERRKYVAEKRAGARVVTITRRWER